MFRNIIEKVIMGTKHVYIFQTYLLCFFYGSILQKYFISFGNSISDSDISEDWLKVNDPEASQWISAWLNISSRLRVYLYNRSNDSNQRSVS